MITTSIARIRKGGLWCPIADSNTAGYAAELGITDDEEVDIARALPVLGVQDTFLALGAVRPRYVKQTQLLLEEYQEYLIETKLAVILMDSDRRALIQALRKESRHQREYLKWTDRRKHAPTPEGRAIADTIVMLLSSFDLAHRVMLATKHYLDYCALGGREYGIEELESIQTWLQEKLDAS